MSNEPTTSETTETPPAEPVTTRLEARGHEVYIIDLTTGEEVRLDRERLGQAIRQLKDQRALRTNDRDERITLAQKERDDKATRLETAYKAEKEQIQGQYLLDTGAAHDDYTTQVEKDDAEIARYEKLAAQYDELAPSLTPPPPPPPDPLELIAQMQSQMQAQANEIAAMQVALRKR